MEESVGMGRYVLNNEHESSLTYGKEIKCHSLGIESIITSLYYKEDTSMSN